jgi:hypothetical protein
MAFSSPPAPAPTQPISNGNDITQMMHNATIAQLQPASAVQPPSFADTQSTIAAIPRLPFAGDVSPNAPPTSAPAGHSYPNSSNQHQQEMHPIQQQQHSQFHSVAQQAPAQQQYYQHGQQQANQQYKQPHPTQAQAKPNSRSQFDPFA